MSDGALELGVDAPAVVALPSPGTRTCGDFGGRTNAGGPCGQVLGPNRTRCAFHPDGPPEVVAAARAELARKAGEARQPHGDPTLRDPDFGSPAKIAKWCEQTTGKLLRGELTDLRTVDMALKAARLALDAYGVGALDQLDKLEALVRNRLHGGAPA